ncbi:PIG-L deacetylase family protein [Streptomyces sp. DSM 44915]|uniref:PIG-L deacetylase family protein n=1 Tax=Streptomyces chisholmiae TaxID=3075540 RepID=A0ABU2JJB2_9ACTN|nr:PIG-L deacetylase family protein [Streptomyces sp. DSM 44915]MDT0265082.1 PIG-L deacetylase family protein [Streptomyces sp. DSM 44915]
MPLDWSRALAVVAHPDDLEYGASGAISAWVAGGREVAYVLVTRGEAGIDGIPPVESARVREAEQRASAAAVGVRTVEFLAHRDGVIEPGSALRADLAAAVRRHRPELLITINHHDTWGGRAWNTPDHRVVGRAVLDAAGDAGNRWIFPEQLAAGDLAPWDGVRWVAVAASPRPTHAQPLDDAALERGIASLVEHRAYVSGLGEADPAGYARRLLTDAADAEAPRFGGRRCATFEVFPR